MHKQSGTGRSTLAICLSFALLILIILIPGARLFAQTDTGRVTGTVTDATGAIIPGATVTLTNKDTGAVQTLTATPDGLFNFAGVIRGNYQVDASKNGFSKTQQSFTLEVSQVQTIEFHLQVGGSSTTVQVTDAAPLVDLATSSIGEVVEGRQITELPLNGRNFTQLALLTPGVTRGQYGNSASGVNGDAETFRNQESGGGALSANGLRQQANNYLLDGLDNNEALVNTLVFFPNIEGTQEFRVNTSVAPAEFGRAGGAIVQTSIKSGTNSIHGSAFEFARSSLFDANPNYSFFGTPSAAPQPFKRNEFGGSIGLPIFKDHLFLFGDYQGYREDTPLNAQLLTVPTALMRTGNFSELIGQGSTNVPTIGCPTVTTVTGRTVTSSNQLNYGNNTGKGNVLPDSGAIFDPLTCRQFGTAAQPNIIPSTRLNKAAVNYLNAYPTPNVPGTFNGTQNNYRTIRRQVTHYNTFDTRLDWNATSHDTAFARFAYDQSDFSRTSEFTALPAGFASGDNTTHGRGIAIGETHTFTANILNEFRAGYNRYTFTNAPVFSGQPISANLGIVNANRTPQLGGGALIGGNSNLEYTGDYGLYAVPENSYQILDSVSYTRGHHSFKFGGNGIRRDVSFFRPISGKGYFNIGAGDFTGYEPSELLAGFIDNYSIGAQSGFFGTRNYEIGVFAQDDWKFTQRLTLNLGVRYDIITYPTEEHNRQSALNVTTGIIDEAGVNGVPRSLVNTDFNNVAPRIGFAYDVYGHGTTVLRGGYGIFYFLDRGGIDNQFGQQAPFGGSVAYTAAQGYRVTLTGQGPLNNNNNTLATSPLPLPGYPGFNPAIPPAGVNIFTTNRNNQIPMVQQYNLQIQQQLGTGTVLSVAFVGNKSDHLATGYNYNTVTLGNGPVLFPNIGQVIAQFNNGTAHYNSLQASLNHRMGNNLTLTTSYTWSHNIDDSDGYLGYYAVSPLYAFNTRINKGNSSLDQRNVFVASALYNLPFGKGQMFDGSWNRGLELVAGGWQLNTVVQAEAGTPITIETPQYGNNYSPRANASGPIQLTHSISGLWFNTSNISAAPLGTEGNIGRNSVFGPGIAEGDVSLFKTLHLTDRFSSELRAEAFNITNTPQFQNPDSYTSDGNFGHVTATRQYTNRQLQMAVRFLF